MLPRVPWHVAGMWPGRRYENGKRCCFLAKWAGSDRNFQRNISVVLVVQSGQSCLTGRLVVTLASNTISNVLMLTSGSLSVRISWPESRAPVEEPGGP